MLIKRDIGKMLKFKLFILPGAGNASYKSFLLKKFLKNKGFDVKYIYYPSTKLNLNQLTKFVNNEIKECGGDVVLIGHSIGGVVAMNIHNNNIIHRITIASPLKGALFSKQMKYITPDIIYRNLPITIQESPNYFINPINNRYTTISTGGDVFDGTIYKKETILNPMKHHHIPFNHHKLILYDYRLFKKIFEILCKIK